MWQINLLMLLPVFLTIIFMIFTVKASRWEDRKSFFVLLIFNIFLAIFSFFVIFGVYKASNQPIPVITVPTGPPPDFTGELPVPLIDCSWRTPLLPCFDVIAEWGYLALVSEILSIVTFIIGLIYYLKKRPQIKKAYKEDNNA